MQWLAQKANYSFLQQAVSLTLLCGTVTALLSAITGYLLSLSDDYDRALVTWHMWMGIGLVIASCVLYALVVGGGDPRFIFPVRLLSIGLFMLIMVTGHLGGSLTHGSDYLTGPLTNMFDRDSSNQATTRPVPNVQEARVFSEVIQPILQTKCFACHGARKQKGGLRMDDTLKLAKGGKDGRVIEPFRPDDSEMIRRLLLPVDDQDHMPPKEKPQPTEGQISLIHWWISEGAGFTKKVKELKQPDRLKPILLALEEVPVTKKESDDIPKGSVEKASDSVIQHLLRKGVMVSPIGRQSNFLMANFVTDTLITVEDLKLLLSLKKQLIWLKMGYTHISNENMADIGQLNNLTRLSLEHTTISDEGLQHLRTLKNLQYLNLVGTKVTARGILQLNGLNPRSLYLYQTNISKSDWAPLKKAFPKTQIDSGGYTVPTEVSDTTEVKPGK